MNIVKSVTVAVNTVKNFTVLHAPEILLGVGLVGFASASAIAVKKTIDVKEDISENIDEIKKVQDLPAYNDEQKKEKLRKNTKAVIRLCFKLAKRYAIPIGLALASVASIIASHNIMMSRAAALAAAADAVLASYNDYRQGVIDKYGKEVDDELFQGIQKKVIQFVDKDTGEVIEEEASITDGTLLNPYGLIYAPTLPDGSKNPTWYDNDIIRRDYIAGVEEFLTVKLQSGQNVWLNTAREAFGYGGQYGSENETKAGRAVAWHYNPDDPTCDNFVTCRAKEVKQYNEVTGEYDTVVIMNFNCDGNVIDSLKEV